MRFVRTLRFALTVLLAGAVVGGSEGTAAAQTVYGAMGYSELHEAGRRLVDEGNRREAIEVYTALLEKHPGDPDALLMRGRIYAWEKDWPRAEADLLAAAERSPGYADVQRALGDMYLWSDRYDSAIEAYNRWQDIAPGAPEPAEAIARVHRARSFDLPLENEVELGVVYDDFSQNRQEWKTGKLDIAHRFGWGKGIFRYSYSERFGRNDQLVELEAYPRLWKKAYGYVNFGFNVDDKFYPDHAYSVFVYQGFGQGWEIAPGYRYMKFDENDVDIYFLGLGKYLGNWFLNVRGTHVPKTGGESQSLRYTARRYFGNSDQWFGVHYGHGSSTELLERSGANETTNSESFGAELEWWPVARWGVKLGAAYEDEAGRPVRRTFDASLGYRW